MPPLTSARLLRDPIRQFAVWFKAADRSRAVTYPTVMCLSTVDRRGWPEGRFVLLKDFDERGFVFYGNIRSAKGKALLASPTAALTLYWEGLKRQVRIQGRTELVSDDEADAYFRTRSRASQLAAWASPQSAPIPTRAILERRVAVMQRRFRGRPVPRPPFWVGFRVAPERLELWQERPNRLHDRFLYTKRAQRGWRIVRLAP